MNGKFDFVVFGATGFTGQYVIEYVARLIRDEVDRQWTFAVAGRNEAKLKRILQQSSGNIGIDLTKVECIICDVEDELSLKNMAQRAKVILNCVGPYRFSGEAVVKVAISEGCHHVDISGEPGFLELMQLRYHDQCVKKGIFVIGACGFDSVPSDLGRAIIHQNMQGPVNSVEMYLNLIKDTDVKGPSINFGTWQSAIHGFANAGDLQDIRRKLYPEKVPKLSPKLPKRGVVHQSNLVDENRWCLMFPGADRSVMIRSERARYFNDGLRPAQVEAYVQNESWFKAWQLAFFFLMFGVLAKFKVGRYLLENYPGIFSFGTVTKEGPPKEIIENSNFKMTVVGRGWNGCSQEEGLSIKDPENRQVKVVVKGKNIGYGSTCEAMVQAGAVLLIEPDRIPCRGGVLTPGYAFANTSLVERLNKRGVTFESTINDL